MKRYLLLLLLAAAPVSAQSVQTTTVTGTVHDFFGVPLRNAEYRILEVQRKGMIIPLTPPHHGYTDSLGALSFVLPRSNYATQDTTKFRIYINAPEYNKNGDRGVWLALPDTSTVTLSTLPRSTYTPPGVAVIVQNIGGGTASAYGDSIRVADSLARYAKEQAEFARAAADSARLLVIARIEADIDTLRARADTAGAYDRMYLYTAIGRLYDSLGVIVSQLSALGSRVDTVGRAERAAIEAQVDAHEDTLTQHRLWIFDNRQWEDSITVHRQRSDMIVASVLLINDTLAVWRPLVYAPSAAELWVNGLPTDSAAVLGGPTDTRGLHAYGGGNFSGNVKAKLFEFDANTYIGNSIFRRNGAFEFYVDGTSEYWRVRMQGGGTALIVQEEGQVSVGPNANTTPRYALEVSGNILMPPDSTAILGTVRTPFIVRDSLGWVKQDTMYVRRFEESAPAWTRNGGTHPYRGEVTFDFSIANSSYGIPVWGNVIADSANGVLISFVEVEMEWGESAQMNSGGMGKFFISNASLNFPTGLAVRTLYLQHVNYSSGVNPQDRGSYSNWGLRFTGRAYMTGKIKVKYTASSKASSYYVKLEGF